MHNSFNPQAAIEAWLAGHAGGIAVTVVTPSGLSFHQAGQMSQTDSRAITSDTLFEIGSITKVFTALLLLLSEKLGKVSRDDPATKFLLSTDDPVVSALEKVTLFALATHTSGLPRLPPGFAPANPLNPYADFTLEKLRAALRKSAQGMPAATTCTYSNFGFSVLGQALAGAWDKSFGEILHEKVLNPLGLEKTSLNLPDVSKVDDLAPGHNGLLPAPNWTSSAMAPAGGLYSSTREMAKFLQACLGLRATPLSAVLAEAEKPLFPLGKQQGFVGFAWHLTAGKVPVVWHNGGTGGYRSFIGYQPTKKRGIAVLANSSRSVDMLGMQLLKDAILFRIKPFPLN